MDEKKLLETISNLKNALQVIVDGVDEYDTWNPSHLVSSSSKLNAWHGAIRNARDVLEKVRIAGINI